ncbi:zonadhesin-like [Anopheles maculipalpis]|uniref:zonadhesin-like n=1 Tax=Anopheles maculipalpis TaxID=1496333 RepID=UPI00215990AB|nr:zonadhesin-like [Anopheles maculipalpis]
MARYVLGVLFLACSFTLLFAIPTDKPAANAVSNTAEVAPPSSPASEPATQPATASEAATQAPTTAEPTTTIAPTTVEEETGPPPIVCTDPREIYDECGSACGDRTCDNQRRSDVKCSKQCVEGCYCRNGYVRDKSRHCIPAYRCGKGLW